MLEAASDYSFRFSFSEKSIKNTHLHSMPDLVHLRICRHTTYISIHSYTTHVLEVDPTHGHEVKIK